MSAIADELLAALESARGRKLLRDALREARESPAANLDDLLTVEQVAKLRKTSTAAVYKLIERGSIAVVRHGRSVRVRRRDLLGGGDGR